MLEHWCQDINNCWNIGPKGCKLASQILWYPFLASGPKQSHKVQHYLGQIEKIFSISALTWSVKPLGDDFNFCTDRDAWFELNLGLDYLCKVGLNPKKSLHRVSMYNKQSRLYNNKSCFMIFHNAIGRIYKSQISLGSKLCMFTT